MRDIITKLIISATIISALLTPSFDAKANFGNCNGLLTNQSNQSLLKILEGPDTVEKELRTYLKNEPWFPFLEGGILRYMSRVVVASGMVLRVTSPQSLPPDLQNNSLLLSPMFNDAVMRLKVMEGKTIVTKDQLREMVEFSNHFGEKNLRLPFTFVKAWAEICVSYMVAEGKEDISFNMAWDALREQLGHQNITPARSVEILKIARYIQTGFAQNEETSPPPVLHSTAQTPVAEPQLQSKPTLPLPQTPPPPSAQEVQQIYLEILAEIHALTADFLAKHYTHPVTGKPTAINKTRFNEIRALYQGQAKQGAPFMGLALFYDPAHASNYRIKPELLTAIQQWLRSR